MAWVSGATLLNGGVGQFAEKLVVVDADDGHFIGHGGVDETARFQHLAAHDVEAGHDAHWFGKRFDPHSELGHLLAPAVVGAMAHVGAVAVELSAGLSDVGFKLVAAPFGPVVLVVAAVGEVLEAAFLEMLEGEAGDGGVVGFDDGAAGKEVGCGEIDGGESAGADGFGDARVFDAGDDAVTFPAGEPGGGRVAAPMLGQVGGPGAMLADVGDHAMEQPSGVVVGGFDEEGDGFAAGGHGLGPIDSKFKMMVTEKVARVSNLKSGQSLT